MSKLIETIFSVYGETELKGDSNNPVIVNMSKELGSNFSWINNDEVPWCSVLVNWAAMVSGLEYSNKANARSWLTVGESVSEEDARAGDVVVFSRRGSPTSGHVAILVRKKGDYIMCLGGNQSDRVQISENYKASSVIGYRRLREV